MSLIIAGRFNTFLEAEKVASVLYREGFSQSDVSLFFVGPPGRHAKYPIGGDVDSDIGADNAHKGAKLGTIFGAVVGALIGTAMFAWVKSPWILSAAAAAVGAWVGALLGAMVLTQRQSKKLNSSNERSFSNAYLQTSRDSGVLIATRVEQHNQHTVIEVLKSSGAADIELAEGQWQDGNWISFDPLQSPQIIA